MTPISGAERSHWLTANDPRHYLATGRWKRIARISVTVALVWLVGVLAATAVRADCFTDVQGADDQPGQKDLSQLCIVGTCGASDNEVSWNFDDTGWSGNNTGDACALFDTNGDGNVERAVCVTVVSDPAVMQSGNPKCYTCGNTRPDRCTGSVLVPCTSTCSVGSDVDPFAGDPNHKAKDCNGTNCRTTDTQTDCCLKTADSGGGVIIDVCSYPSQQPNSDPSDCVVNRQCSKTDPNDPACNDNNPCTVDSCDTTIGVCHHVAGNQGTQCRGLNGVCDVAEVCDGSSIYCPADQFAQSGVCRAASDLCDVAESCDGTSADCPADGAKGQGTVCRADTGQCDVQEVCDGVSKACPADGFEPNNTPCNDNDACTTGDVCVGGVCTGGAPFNCNDNNVCTDDSCNSQTGCVHTNNNDSCSDGNACTTGDTCSGGSCVGGPPPNCNDNNVCTDDGCNPSTGCTHTNNTASCDDGNACTGPDTCSGGSCPGGPPTNCDDNNACTTDSCSPGDGCHHDPVPNCCNTDSQCADSDQCTTNERCVNNACVSDPVVCNDNNPCTDDSCNPATGCVVTNNNDPCNDNNACTTNDTCSGGSCHGGPPPNCNDNDVCTDDGCNPASGCTHTNNTAPCDDGSECTTNDHCLNDACAGGPAPNCDDGNVCTDDTCSPTTPGGCVHTNNTAPCSDGNGCTVGDVCSGGVCTSGGPKNCNDFNECTDDSCFAPSGTCQHLNNVDPCSDQNECTVGDVCQNGVCAPGGPKDCNDQNDCTDDSCEAPFGTCLHDPNSEACNDQNACTTNDTCTNGACVGGPPPNCDDGNVCTDDGCDPATGCTHVNNNAPCSDNNACTTGDACSNGACVGGPPPDCNDNDVCTDDGCNQASGCTHTNNTAPCDDGSQCTTNDRCLNDACVGGPPPSCDDGNMCTTDSCVAATGCHHEPVPQPCCNVNSDCLETPDDKCTMNERCVNHACVSDAVNCNDNNVCTDDGCNPATGCTHVNNSDPCDDNNACTTPDTCGGGACVGGPAPNCNDGNVCTDDTCDPATGCVFTPITCNDHSACTTDTCNPATGCVFTPVTCNDGNPCTTDTCNSVQGCVSTPVNCDDLNECTADSCDAQTGACQHAPKGDGTPCTDTDEDVCTVAACTPSGTCDQSHSLSDKCLLTNCDIGYPFASDDPRTSVYFNESEVLRAFRPQGSITATPGLTIKAWYNDEHSLTLGVRRIIVKTKTGTTTTDYPVSPQCTPAENGCSVFHPEVGAMALDGEQAGTDTSTCVGFPDLCDRPMFPALFITDITDDPNNKSGDWQFGGTPIPPDAVFGTWKAAVKTIDKRHVRTLIRVRPDRNSVRNNWNLGSGDPVPAPTPKNERRGAEVRWDVDELIAAGQMVAGHNYRLQFMVHDGDQNRKGGDSAQNCVNVRVGAAP